MRELNDPLYQKLNMFTIGTHLLGAGFAADESVGVLNQPGMELIGFSFALSVSEALLSGVVLLSCGAMPSDFAADGAFVAVKLFGDFGDGLVVGEYRMRYSGLDLKQDKAASRRQYG